jgi:type I site-specific restriction-modification system R (restriction) subunit
MEQFSQIGQIERKTQDRVIEFFKKELGYDYLGNWEKRENNGNIEETLLKEYLQKQNYSENLIKKAIAELIKTSTNQQKSLYDKNKDVYSLLRYGLHIKESQSETTKTVWPIDWRNPRNNHFAIAEEVTIIGKYNKRPDIVIYVNGIALGVLELKRSSISIGEGIRQNLDNQKKEFIPQFFTTQQIILAGNDTQGLRYGTVLTPAKYYMEWKEEEAENISGIEKIENILDRALFFLLKKSRFLELIYNFIIFDKGIKKIARHNQYFAVKSAQKSLICSLIHKFGRTKNNYIEQYYENYIEELKQNLPKEFNPKGNIYVFVDECHRTQSGKLHKAMKSILPNSVFIGFTGTPLLKKDKLSTLETFGNYIHTYKFDRAVEDGVILDLRYEARDVDQKIDSQERIDTWFEAKTKGLTDVARNQLKKKWGTMQKL